MEKNTIKWRKDQEIPCNT